MVFVEDLISQLKDSLMNEYGVAFINIDSIFLKSLPLELFLLDKKNFYLGDFTSAIAYLEKSNFFLIINNMDFLPINIDLKQVIKANKYTQRIVINFYKYISKINDDVLVNMYKYNINRLNFLKNGLKKPNSKDTKKPG